MAPPRARGGPARVLHSEHGRPPCRRGRTSEEAVLQALVLLARDQPRDPVREAGRGYGFARQLAARFLARPAGRGRAALHVSHARAARDGSSARATARRRRIRARAVAMVLRRHREAAVGRTQRRDPVAAGDAVVTPHAPPPPWRTSGAGVVSFYLPDQRALRGRPAETLDCDRDWEVFG